MNSILIRVQIRAVDDKQAGLSVACVFFVKRWRGEYRRQRGLQVGGLGLSSPRKCSNLGAPKHCFQH